MKNAEAWHAELMDRLHRGAAPEIHKEIEYEWIRKIQREARREAIEEAAKKIEPKAEQVMYDSERTVREWAAKAIRSLANGEAQEIERDGASR